MVAGYNQSFSASALATEHLFAELQEWQIAIPHPDELAAYLARHSDMVGVVTLVAQMVRQEFQDAAHISLEVFEDPDAEDEYPTFYVRQEEYEPQIMDRIEKLWSVYGPALAGKSGWLLVTTDFRRP